MMVDQQQYPTGQEPVVPHVPDWVSDAVFYQIFPERFANGDPTNDPPRVEPWGGVPTRTNFFGGDLRGIAGHLDYLSDLGITALYLTPIFDAQTSHKYDTSDYTRIDPHFGDIDTFRSLLTGAHERGMRVVLDAVFNHCGDGHWAFRDVLTLGAESPYVNWFYIEDTPAVQEPVPNYATCGGAVYLPKLNVHNPAVRQYLWDVTEQWTREGIDGWRLDVPYMMNHQFWKHFRRLVKGLDSDLYIVAEVWDRATTWVRGDEADGAMNYRLRDLILAFIVDRTLDGAGFGRELAVLAAELPHGAAPSMLNLLGSHDTTRILTRCGGNHAAVALALGLLFSSVGAPMIYYGDENGMEGENDPDCRRCMSWDEATWDREIRAWVRTLTRLRREHVALRRGDDETILADGDIFVRRRRHLDEEILVLLNRGATPVELAVPGWTGRALRDLITGAPCLPEHPIKVAARSICFLASGGPAATSLNVYDGEESTWAR